MARPSSATPLLALDAVVIDTETTALDPRKAQIVEIAAVPLVAGRIADDRAVRRLVRPREAIPAAATAVHGIDDAAVENAPSFAQAWPEISACMGRTIVVGYALGFDLAVIKRECDLAGIAWQPPRALDTRLLAQVAEPSLAGYSLESLAAWLGIELKDRHSAVGDAIACARIFNALIPKLRDRRVRTLGEAERACRALTDALDAQYQAGWVESSEARRGVEAESTLARIDSYPYRHRIRDVMRAPPHLVSADTSLRQALTHMTQHGISSVYVHPPRCPEGPIAAADAAIVTERDVLRALAGHGDAALDLPVEHFMSRPLASVPEDAFIYRAIGRMNALHIRHLAAVDDAGLIVGALSARDLLRLRAGVALALGDEIDRAEDARALALAWENVPHVAAALLDEDVPARDIAAVISRELGALTRCAAIIAEQRMRQDGRGDPPCRYAVAVLGSAGRDESLLAMDQDNALFFAHGEPGGDEDQWFAALGRLMSDLLHQAGVPYCRGGIMASEPGWRGSLATWRERIEGWMRHSDPADLLSVDIFFDLRSVHGDTALANAPREAAFDSARKRPEFAKMLAEAPGTFETGLTLLRRFRTENGRIDLKKYGLFGIVVAARVLAVLHHVVERSTPGRLAAIKALGIGGGRDLDALAEAHVIFLDMILAQQIDDIRCGMPPSNKVAVKSLSRRDRDRLREALRVVEPLDTLLRDLLFTD